MTKEQLQERLGLKTRQWQRWCKALGFSASLEAYSEEQIEQLERLRQLLNEKMAFDDAVTQITGKSQQQGGLGNSLATRYSREINQLAPSIADAMVEALDRAVMASFEQKLKSSKPRIFEQFLDSFSLAIDSDDVLDAMLLEGADDES